MIFDRISDFSIKIRDFDAVIIETTGLADPAPVAQTFFVDEKVRELCARRLRG